MALALAIAALGRSAWEREGWQQHRVLLVAASICQLAALCLRAAIDVYSPAGPVPLLLTAVAAASLGAASLGSVASIRTDRRSRRSVAATGAVTSFAALGLRAVVPSEAVLASQRTAELGWCLWITVGATVVHLVTVVREPRRRGLLGPAVVAVLAALAALVAGPAASVGVLVACAAVGITSLVVPLQWWHAIVTRTGQRTRRRRPQARLRQQTAAARAGGGRAARRVGGALRAAGTRAADLLSPVGTDGGPTGPHRMGRSDRWWAVAAATATAAFIAARAIWAHRTGWQITGDSAKIMARAHDVGTRHTLLTGMPTQVSGAGGSAANHPGPANVDLLAPFVRVLGFRTGAFVGAGIITFTGWMLTTWGAFRAGGRRSAVLWWVACALVTHLVLKGDFFDPVVFPIVLCITATLTLSWAASSGDDAALPLALLTATLAAQTYLPYVPISVVAAAWATMIVWGRARGETSEASARRALWWGAGILAVTWAQPIAYNLANRGESLRALSTAVTTPVPEVGWGGALDAVLWMFRIPPGFSRFAIASADDADAYFAGLGPTGLLVAAGLLAFCWTTRDRVTTSERRLRILLLLVVGISMATLPRLPSDDVRWYYLTWLGVAATLVWVVIAESALSALDRAGWRPQVAPAVARAGVAVGCLALLVVTNLASTRGLTPYRESRAHLDTSSATLVRAALDTERTSDPVLVLTLEDSSADVADAIIGQMIADGREVRVEPAITNYYGSGRAAGRTWDGAVLATVDGTDPSDPPDGTTVLARVEPEGWAHDRFEADARELRAWVDANGPLIVSDPARAVLPSYAGGTDGLDCDDLAAFADGRRPLSDLPPSAIARLYADGAVISPRLPDGGRRFAVALGDRPIELWSTPRATFDDPASAYILRSGEQCDPARFGPGPATS